MSWTTLQPSLRLNMKLCHSDLCAIFHLRTSQLVDKEKILKLDLVLFLPLTCTAVDADADQHIFVYIKAHIWSEGMIYVLQLFLVFVWTLDLLVNCINES